MLKQKEYVLQSEVSHLEIRYFPQEETPEIENVNYINVLRPEGYRMNFREARTALGWQMQHPVGSLRQLSQLF